jgi:hypothetical protein
MKREKGIDTEWEEAERNRWEETKKRPQIETERETQ